MASNGHFLNCLMIWILLMIWPCLPTTKNQMQDKTCRLETFSAKTGLRINLRKTELIKINTTANTPITVEGEPIKEVESFVYLGSTITKQGGTDEDVTSRIGKARSAFIMLKKVWTSKEISTETRMRIFNSNVKSVLFYGCETWKATGGCRHFLIHVSEEYLG